MKKLSKLLVGTIAATSMAGAAQAQSLFQDLALEDVSAKSQVALDGAVRTRQVVLDKAVADQMFSFTEQSKSLQMSLFAGDHFKLTRTNLDRYFGEGLKVWSGRVEGFEDGFATLISDNGRLIGQIQYGSKIYRISPSQSGLHVITEIDALSFPQEEDIDHFDTSSFEFGSIDGAENLNDDLKSKSVFSRALDFVKKLSSRPDRIKVMVMFTPTAATEATNAGTHIRDEAILAMGMANTALVNTGLTIYKLSYGGTVGFGGCDYPAQSSTSTVLRDVTFQNSCVSARAASLRNTRSADLVAVIKGAGGCGTAWYSEGGVTQGSGYSVTARACIGQHTFTHELGHNMGLNHDRVPPGHVGTNQSSYNYGLTHPNEATPFRTIMAYNNNCSSMGVFCTRVPIFTGVAANGKWNGVRTGRALYQTDPAISRRSLRENWAAIAAFR